MKSFAVSPAKYRTVKGKWPFILTETLKVDLCLGLKGRHEFWDGDLHLGTLVNDVLDIFPGYASDGASPHFFTIWKIRIGTPSHQRIASAWFAHDFLYQFGRLPCCPWTYEQADDVLYNLMRQNGSILAAPYHAAVSIFGGLHRRISGGGSETICCKTKHKTN